MGTIGIMDVTEFIALVMAVAGIVGGVTSFVISLIGSRRRERIDEANAAAHNKELDDNRKKDIAEIEAGIYALAREDLDRRADDIKELRNSVKMLVDSDAEKQGLIDTSAAEIERLRFVVDALTIKDIEKDVVIGKLTAEIAEERGKRIKLEAVVEKIMAEKVALEKENGRLHNMLKNNNRNPSPPTL